MGLDLTLCPDRYEDTISHVWHFAHTRIDTDRDGAFYDAILALPAQALPATVRFQWYGDEGIETRTTDPYGAPLTWLCAEQFRQIRLPLSPWNQAALAFVQALPPARRVVLWWH